MVSDEAVRREQGRLRLLLVLMLTAFVGLGIGLFRVQVLRASEYRSSFDQQSIRRVRVPASRGLIHDRNGILLADNRPNYCIAIYIEELRQPGRWSNTIDRVEEVIEQVSTIIGRPREIDRTDIDKHIQRRLPLPLTAWNDIDQEAMARLEEHLASLTGVDVAEEPLRTYPLGTVGAHVLGYVGRKDVPKNDAEPYNYYLPEMIGKSGLERVFNETLAGRAGGYLIRVDASGYPYKRRNEHLSTAGKDIYLTLDSRIQRLCEESLSGQRGAAVMLDPRNGDVLAMASAPTFDPNMFVGGISTADWNSLRLDKTKPMLNRAIMEVYPPGSTFKPVVAIASLENGRSTADTMFTCVGYYELGHQRFHCWNHSGHGNLTLREAIKHSCNPYFCQLGLKCGYSRIAHMADALGIGHRCGIELFGEESGNLPTRHSDGDTCNVSIGQGALTVTPLQMAVVVATIANQGTVYRPRLVRGSPRGDVVKQMGWAPETMRVVRGGMYDVVQAVDGTGKRAAVAGVEVGAKTGTAQYGPRGQGRKHTWMIAFAPFAAPRYALAIVIEDGDSGGRTVAPLISQVLTGTFNLDGTLR